MCKCEGMHLCIDVFIYIYMNNVMYRIIIYAIIKEHTHILYARVLTYIIHIHTKRHKYIHTERHRYMYIYVMYIWGLGGLYTTI